MSFWNFVKDVAPLLMAGATLYGASSSSKASEKAANTMASAQREGTAAQLQGLKMAKEELAINRTAASPGLLATQEVINRGAALTPQQQQAVADSREQALNALKGSSLRGSARATSAIVADTDQRVRDNFASQNQGRADTAAMNLSNNFFSAGNNMSNNATQAGGVISQGLVNTGNINAANTLGQGALSGQAIGDIGAIIADAAKSKVKEERDSSYAKVGG